MLTIRTSKDPSEVDPAKLLARDLLACHGHIRRFTDVAGRVASARDTSAHEVSAAASALVDYFGRALPLHVLDEELSLRPRLLALPEDQVLATAVARMHDEHGPVERLLAEALPCWRRLTSPPGVPAAAVLDALESSRAELTGLARALAASFTGHLAGEEAEVFPALVRLSADELVAIRHEMKQRRALALPGPLAPSIR